MPRRCSIPAISGARPDPHRRALGACHGLIPNHVDRRIEPARLAPDHLQRAPMLQKRIGKGMTPLIGLRRGGLVDDFRSVCLSRQSTSVTKSIRADPVQSRMCCTIRLWR